MRSSWVLLVALVAFGSQQACQGGALEAELFQEAEAVWSPARGLGLPSSNDTGDADEDCSTPACRQRKNVLIKDAREQLTAQDIAEAPLVGRVPYDTFPARSDGRAELCQNCTSRCGTLARTWVLDRDMGGLTAGTVMAEGTFSLCERRLRAKVGYCVPAQVPRRFEMCEDPFGTGATPPPSATAAPLSTTEKAALAAENAAAAATADAAQATADAAVVDAPAQRNGTAIALAALQAAAAEADAENKTAAADTAKASWLSWKKDTTERGTSARMLAEAARIRAGVGPRGIVATDRIESATAPVSAPPPPAPAPPSGGGQCYILRSTGAGQALTTYVDCQDVAGANSAQACCAACTGTCIAYQHTSGANGGSCCTVGGDGGGTGPGGGGTPSPSATPPPTDTPSPSATPPPTDTPSPSATPPPTDTPSPSATPPPPSDTPSPSETPPPSDTPSTPPTLAPGSVNGGNNGNGNGTQNGNFNGNGYGTGNGNTNGNGNGVGNGNYNGNGNGTQNGNNNGNGNGTSSGNGNGNGNGVGNGNGNGNMGDFVLPAQYGGRRLLWAEEAKLAPQEQKGWLAWVMNLLRQLRDASNSEAAMVQQKAVADAVGVSHETHPRLLQEFLGVPKGQDVKLVPSGYPGLAYLPYTDTGLTITVGVKDPNAFPRHLFGCPFPPSRTGACVPPPNCDCDKNGKCGATCELGDNLFF